MIYLLLSLVLLWPALGWGQTIVASGTAYPTWSDPNSCVAPCAVLFDAQASTHSTLSEEDEWKAMQYEWDFNDTDCTDGADTWPEGNPHNRDKCSDLGPVAGHVYEAAGTYYATVTVSYPGATSQSDDTNSFTVVAADSFYPTTATECVRDDATPNNWTGCPTGATQTTSADFDAAIGATPAADTRYLFRRGDTFAQGTTINLVNDGITIGAWGDSQSAKPHIDAGGRAFYIDDNVRIMDLDYDGTDAANVEWLRESGVANVPYASHVLIYRVDVADYWSFITIDMDGATEEFWDTIHDIAVVDCTNSSQPAVGGPVFVYAQRFMFMGNNLGSIPSYHQFRLPFVRPGVVSHNYIGPITTDSARHQLKIHGDQLTGEPTRASGHIVFGDNYLVAGVNKHVAEMSSSGARNTRIEYLRFERNYIELHATTATNIGLLMGANDSLVANNIVFAPAAAVPAYQHLKCGKKDAYQLNAPDAVWFANNTCLNLDSEDFSGGYDCIRINADCTNAVVKNTLMYAPNTAQETVLDDGGPSTDDGGATNLAASSNPFTESSWDDPNDYQITDGSEAEGEGVHQNSVPEDYGLRTRDSELPDVGAWLFNELEEEEEEAPPPTSGVHSEGSF